MHSIREATLDDIPLISGLAHKIWPVCYRNMITEEQISYMLSALYSAQALHKQIADEGQQFILIYQKQEPVGFASYTKLREAFVYKLNKLYLLPQLHGHGLGKALLSAIEQRVLAHKGKQLILNVNRNNPAVGFYTSCGYSISEEVDIPIGAFWMNDFVMSKNLP